MRLLALTSEFPPFVGGIGTYAAELARAAAAQGIAVTLATPDYGQDLGAADRRDYPFAVVRYPGGPHRASMLPAKVALTRHLMARQSFDRVHAMDWSFFLPAALVARHVPRLYSVHGSDIATMSRPSKRAAIAAAGVFRGDMRVLGISAFTLALFRRQFPFVPADKTAVVPLGVGNDWLSFDDRPDREALGLPADRLVVATLARLTRRKGHLTALAALNLLPQTLKAKVFYAIVGPDGEPDYRLEVERAMAVSTVPVRRFSGLDRRGVMALCAASDIFCLPGGTEAGLVEGFGLVLLEAGALGLPLIAGHHGGVGEIISAGDGGLLVPVGEAQALAGALARLMDDPELRAQLGRAARARAEALTWERCARLSYGFPER